MEKADCLSIFYVGECEQVHVTLIECIVVDIAVAAVAALAAAGCFDQKIKTNAAHLLSDKAKSRSRRSQSHRHRFAFFSSLMNVTTMVVVGWVGWWGGKAL